jgi:ATP-dependent helicase/nuclease subunit B
LGLKPLEDLDAPADARDYGNLVHKVLEEFNRRYKTGDYPANAKQILEQIAETEFAAMGIDAELKMFWRARLAKTLDWLVQTEQVYRPRIDYIFSEVQGERQYQGPVGVWKITARADRLEQWSDGSLCVVDYKTGSLPKNIAKLVKLGYKPQLSIEGLIAASGGFTDVAARPIKFLRYWQMDGQEILLNEAESNEAMQHAEQNIRQLIAAYDDPNRTYLTKPNPKTAPAQTDYDHLSRYLEWAVKDDSEDNDGDD